MKRSCLVLVFVLATWTAAFAQTAKGTLVVVGGGGTTHAIVAKTLELAGGKNAIVAVLPQSSAVADAGDTSVKMWLDAGRARQRARWRSHEPERGGGTARATLIWMPGGDQNRFMKAIEGTGLDEVIRERHRAGAVVGGTSAGAAVLAEAMFTGDADLKSLDGRRDRDREGAGLWPEALIDQHFLAAAARQPPDQRRPRPSRR